MRLAQRTLRTARLHPVLHCVCGHVLNGHDLDLDKNQIRLICPRCHQQLLEITVAVIDDQGERGGGDAMVLSAQTIRALKLVSPLREPHTDPHGNSAGLSACGYDLTLAKDITIAPGAFVLVSTAEHFSLPDNVVGIVHDKSSLVRRGLVVQNTVAEPAWQGHLTVEFTNHGEEFIAFIAGAAICQVVFHFLDEPTCLPYRGKYQDQGPEPQKAL
jgi:dCTP deaminase